MILIVNNKRKYLDFFKNGLICPVPKKGDLKGDLLMETSDNPDCN